MYNEPLDYSVAIQTTRSFLKTPYSDVGVLVGKRGDEGTFFGLGPVYRRYFQNIRTSKDYYGFRVEAVKVLNDKLLMILSAEMIKGEYLKYTVDERTVIQNAFELMGYAGLGYSISDQVVLYVQYTPTVYDPRNYKPHDDGAFRQHEVTAKLVYYLSFR